LEKCAGILYRRIESRTERRRGRQGRGSS
jgi:hypothetical protein